MTFAASPLFLLLIGLQVGVILIGAELVREIRAIRSDQLLFGRGLIDQSDLGN